MPDDFHPDFDPILEQLFDLYDKLSGTPLKGKYQGLDDFVSGWFSHVHDGVIAVLAMTSQGLGHETAPIRRSIVEHTLALKWLRMDGPDVINTFGRGTVQSLKRLDAAQDKFGVERMAAEQLQEIVDHAESVDKSNDQYINFSQRADKLGGNAERVAWGGVARRNSVRSSHAPVRL